MALGQLLDQIRDYYVSRFIDAVNEHAADDKTTVAHESAFRNSDGDIVTEGELGLPTRGDLFIIRDGAVIPLAHPLVRVLDRIHLVGPRDQRNDLRLVPVVVPQSRLEQIDEHRRQQGPHRPPARNSLVAGQSAPTR